MADPLFTHHVDDFSDEFSGTSLSTVRWTVTLGGGASYSVAGGQLLYASAVPGEDLSFENLIHLPQGREHALNTAA